MALCTGRHARADNLEQGMHTLSDRAVLIGKSLAASELVADQAIAEDARTITTIIEQFREAGLSQQIDQAAIELATQGLTLAVERRAKLRALHGRLAAQARKHQLDPSAYGDTENYPSAATHAVQPALRAVS
jgi:hypothetical protein